MDDTTPGLMDKAISAVTSPVKTLGDAVVQPIQSAISNALSPLTQPTITFRIYTYENNVLKVKPSSIISDITISYLTKPKDVVWGFTTNAQGAYLYAEGSSIQFDLDVVEQDELVLRILAYAGVIIQDPTIIQAASQAVAAQDANEKQ